MRKHSGKDEIGFSWFVLMSYFNLVPYHRKDSFSYPDPGDDDRDDVSKSDLLNSSNDFCNKGPPAARLFGMREVI